MSATLTIIGCRAGAPAGGASASGYLIESAERRLLVDCGPGVVLTLATQEPFPAIDAVVISHRHADHCADLVALAYRRRFPQALPPLPLFGPPDLLPLLARLDELFGMESLPALVRPLQDTFAFHPVTPGATFEAAGFLVESCAAHHPVPTLSLRWPTLGFVYTADTALHSDLISFATGADLLLAEATYADEAGHDLQTHGHMTAAHAGILAQQAGVKRLTLTHLADLRIREVTRQVAELHYDGPITIAEAGQTCTLAETGS
jgi:ribonuclease BN (tRNA processing enzyme)